MVSNSLRSMFIWSHFPARVCPQTPLDSHWASGPDNWILTSVAEIQGVWNLATNYHGAYFLFFLQTAETNSSQISTRLCRRDVVVHKYQLFISDICEWLVYEQHLSTYPPSDRDRRYYSMWLHNLFHPMQPIYCRVARRKCYKIYKNEPFLPGSFCAIDAFICSN